VVLELFLGSRSGLDLLKQLKQVSPRIRVLILSMHSEEQYARRAFGACAAGYITKDISRAELSEAIDKVITGGRYVSPVIAEKLVIYLEKSSGAAPQDALSDREFQVMQLTLPARQLVRSPNCLL